MKKLLKALKWIDDNLLFLTVAAFTLAVSLYPKLPLFHVEYTYIKIRVDDFFIIPVFLVYIIQVIRRKNPLRLRFAPLIALYWIALFVSLGIGFYLQHTVPVYMQGILHAVRRIQYMAIFFVALSSVDSEKTFMRLMKIFIAGVFLVSLYGLGQKFLHFPSIQSMNPAYADGRILFLNPEDRINSTFGGHFDLAAYLVFAIPILFGFLFYTKEKRYFVTYVIALTAVLYTAARSSFGAYVTSVVVFLLAARKFLFLILVMAITAALLLVTGEMTKRILDTFQIKTVFVNPTTGSTTIDQKLSTKQLPAGNLRIKLPGTKVAKATNVDKELLRKAAIEQAEAEARKHGITSVAQIENRANEISKVLQPQKMLLCDISCSTRLQVEWPRAISSFLYNPLFGTGPYSLGEATDNSILRWFGESGLVGAGIFMALLVAIVRSVWKAARRTTSNKKYIFYGYVVAVFSLFINALYVDAFEASKMAYNFWLVTGIYIGYLEVMREADKASK